MTSQQLKYLHEFLFNPNFIIWWNDKDNHFYRVSAVRCEKGVVKFCVNGRQYVDPKEFSPENLTITCQNLASWPK